MDSEWRHSQFEWLGQIHYNQPEQSLLMHNNLHEQVLDIQLTI